MIGAVSILQILMRRKCAISTTSRVCKCDLSKLRECKVRCFLYSIRISRGEKRFEEMRDAHFHNCVKGSIYFIPAGGEIMHAAGPRGGRTPAASNLNNQKYSNVIEFIATASAVATLGERGNTIKVEQT